MFYVHVYGITIRRENKPNAILIVSTFQHLSARQENHQQSPNIMVFKRPGEWLNSYCFMWFSRCDDFRFVVVDFKSVYFVNSYFLQELGLHRASTYSSACITTVDRGRHLLCERTGDQQFWQMSWSRWLMPLKCLWKLRRASGAAWTVLSGTNITQVCFDLMIQLCCHPSFGPVSSWCADHWGPLIFKNKVVIRKWSLKDLWKSRLTATRNESS